MKTTAYDLGEEVLTIINHETELEYTVLDQLGFYAYQYLKLTNRLPEGVKSLDGKKVSLMASLTKDGNIQMVFIDTTAVTEENKGHLTFYKENNV